MGPWRTRPFIRVEFPGACGTTFENDIGLSTVGGNARGRRCNGVSPLLAPSEKAET